MLGSWRTSPTERAHSHLKGNTKPCAGYVDPGDVNGKTRRRAPLPGSTNHSGMRAYVPRKNRPKNRKDARNA